VGWGTFKAIGSLLAKRIVYPTSRHSIFWMTFTSNREAPVPQHYE
jgi:hypothetical protein